MSVCLNICPTLSIQLLVLVPYTSGQSSAMPNPNVYGRATCHLSSFSPAVHANIFLLTSILYYTFLPTMTANHSIYNLDIKKKK